MSVIEISKVKTYGGHKDAVYTLESAGQSSEFFSGAGDGMVVKWDLQTPDKGKLIANLPTSVYALQYISNGDRLIIGQNYQGIHVIDLASKKESGSLLMTQSAIFDIKHHNGRLIIATGDGTIHIVELEGLSIVETIKKSEKSARSIAINSQTNEFAVGYSDHLVRVFDSRTYQLKNELSGHTNSVFTVVYHPNNQQLLTAGRDAHLKVWQMDQGYRMKESIVAHMYAINHIEFSPNGQHFVTCSMDKSIKVWNASDFKLLKVIDKARYAGHGTSVNKLYWSSFKQQLASCSDDRTISVWDLKNLTA